MPNLVTLPIASEGHPPARSQIVGALFTESGAVAYSASSVYKVIGTGSSPGGTVHLSRRAAEELWASKEACSTQSRLVQRNT